MPNYQATLQMTLISRFSR